MLTVSWPLPVEVAVAWGLPTPRLLPTAPAGIVLVSGPATVCTTGTKRRQRCVAPPMPMVPPVSVKEPAPGVAEIVPLTPLPLPLLAQSMVGVDEPITRPVGSVSVNVVMLTGVVDDELPRSIRIQNSVLSGIGDGRAVPPELVVK